jgi:hypothetical protein
VNREGDKKLDSIHCIGLHGLRSVVLDECGCVVGSNERDEAKLYLMCLHCHS